MANAKEQDGGIDLLEALEELQDVRRWRLLDDRQFEDKYDWLTTLEHRFEAGFYLSRDEQELERLFKIARANCVERNDAPAFVTVYWRRCDSNAEVKEVEELFEFACEDDGGAYRRYGKHLIESAGWEAFGVSFANEDAKRTFVRCFSYTELGMIYLVDGDKGVFSVTDDGWFYVFATKN